MTPSVLPQVLKPVNGCNSVPKKTQIDFERTSLELSVSCLKCGDKTSAGGTKKAMSFIIYNSPDLLSYFLSFLYFLAVLLSTVN